MRERTYMSQLDALRFFAILGVLVEHFWQPHPLPWIFGSVRWGDIGVRLFFVLSGFLITGILLGGRGLAESGRRSQIFFLRQFYVRRFLRIFPIYYLTLVVILLAGVWPARQIAPWLFTYTTNVYIWHEGQWVGNVGHFWSLAVEEQFYVFWPVLLLFAPRRWLAPLLVTLICLAPLYRLYASFRYSHDVLSGNYTSGTFTPALFDSLGLGALLAIFARRARESTRFRGVLVRVVLPLGLIVYTGTLAARYAGDIHGSFALSYTALALVFCWLIGVASVGFGGIFGRVLEWRPLAYLGKISYGAYIFHYFVPLGLAYLVGLVGVAYPKTGFANFVLASAVTFGIAAISWHLFEAPINNLKRLFPYKHRRETAPELVVAVESEASPSSA